MKKKILAVLALGSMLIMSGCGTGAYQGKISFGNEKEAAEKIINDLQNDIEEQLEEVAQIAEDLVDSKEVDVRDISEYDGKEISGWELHAFIDKYKGNPDIAIIVRTRAFGGLGLYNGDGYIGKVGYENLPAVYVMDDLGMLWYSGINYNALYQGNIKTNEDGTEFYDKEGFVKDTDGKVKMYTNFEDAGIDTSYTEHIAGDSKFNTIPVKNSKGEITGIFFEESM